MIIGVVYDGGRLRVEVDDASPLQALLDAVAAVDGRYAGGSLQAQAGSSEMLTDLSVPVGSVLAHGTTVFARIRPPEGPGQQASPATHAEDSRVPPANSEPHATSAGGSRNNICRICHDAEETKESGRLFSPCKCAGTMKHVHVTCLNEWRRMSSNPQSFYQCDQCLYRYSLHRATWALWLMSESTVLLAAAALSALLTMLTAVLVQIIVPDMAIRVYMAGRFVPPWHVYHHWSAPYFDFYIAGAAGVACIGAGMYLISEYRMMRDRDDGWRHLVHFGLWLASLSHQHLARVGMIVGLAVSYKNLFDIARQQCLHWSTTYGEMLLEVHANS
ncbi:hypothetical protein PBRA_003147 [Plasmodiophora brassicae]|nr:hypothetical protein PBRA_003147 [Plasmodiophora brassicae]